MSGRPLPPYRYIPRGPLERAYDELQAERTWTTLYRRVIGFMALGMTMFAIGCVWAFAAGDWNPAWLACAVGWCVSLVLLLALLEARRI